ncbi:MAG: MFS transporter [Candidatus Bathyarchaeota archaeon]|nr:MFS transporter [Candidatus Bathyarchaeota archaeon]
MKSYTPKAGKAYIAIILLGIVSLMGDVVYEGSKGLVPGYLAFLGASAFVVVFAGQLGEFLGYALRLISGVLSDATRAYWFFMLLGYGLIISIPLLGFSYAWESAIILILLERMGKALRAPSRDAIISVIGMDLGGAGKAFGIHEFLDQIGAVLGPLLVTSVMFYSGGDYRLTFHVLFFPFIVLLIVLGLAYARIGKSSEPGETRIGKIKNVRFEKPFYIYTLAVVLNTIGLIPYGLILYKVNAIVPLESRWIPPLIYTVMMLVDAPAALLSGYAYDRLRIKILILPFALSVIAPLLAMADASLAMLTAAAVFLGIVVGMQESVYRAAVSEFTYPSTRGTAYGIFNTAYGVGLLASGVVYGLMATLDVPYYAVVMYVLTTQMVAVALLLNAHFKRQKAEDISV